MSNEMTGDDLMDPVATQEAVPHAEQEAVRVALDEGPDAAPGPTPPLVRDVMLTRPKTLPGNASVGDARRLFADPKVITAILVDGTAFVGTLERSALPSLLPDVAPVRSYARRGVPTTTPQRPVQEAIAAMDAGRSTRLVVLEDDRVTLAGLLCLDARRGGFCRG